VDGAIASRAVVDLDGRYTGEMAFYAYGPFKADAIRSLTLFEGIDLAGSYAYSDSYTDVPMLEVVGHPVAVNPDRVLARLARERAGRSGSSPGPSGCATGSRSPNLPTAAAVTGAAWRLGGGHAGVALQPAADRQLTTVGRAGARRGHRPARGSGFAQPLGGDESEGDEDGEDQQLLHVGDPTHRSRHQRPDQGRSPAPERRAGPQTVRRSRAPVSEDGWRSFDMARASI
jgi:hypothetical protein